MNIRFGSLRAPWLVLCVLYVAIGSNGPTWGQDKEKNSIKSLFDGIPADLRSKVRDNPVRCDRVNDWLKEHGKGKALEVRLGVENVVTQRSPDDETYRVRLSLRPANVNAFDDEWRAHFGNQGSSGPGGPRYYFSFEGVSTAEAEKLVDLKQVVIQGKVQDAKLARSGVDSDDGKLIGIITIAMEDVRVDGKKWTPYNFSFGGGKKKGGAPVEQPKKGKGKQVP